MLSARPSPQHSIKASATPDRFRPLMAPSLPRAVTHPLHRAPSLQAPRTCRHSFLTFGADSCCCPIRPTLRPRSAQDHGALSTPQRCAPPRGQHNDRLGDGTSNQEQPIITDPTPPFSALIVNSCSYLRSELNKQRRERTGSEEPVRRFIYLQASGIISRTHKPPHMARTPTTTLSTSLSTKK